MLLVFERAVYIHGGGVVLRVQHYYIKLLGVVIEALLFRVGSFVCLVLCLVLLTVGDEYVFKCLLVSTHLVIVLFVQCAAPKLISAVIPKW